MDGSFPQKTIYSENEKCRICDGAMSGIEFSRAAKEKDAHVCASCMNAVTQTFSHFQEQIRKLRSEKVNLQEEIEKLRKVGEGQTRVMMEEIRALKEELVMLKKESKSLKESVGARARLQLESPELSNFITF